MRESSFFGLWKDTTTGSLFTKNNLTKNREREIHPYIHTEWGCLYWPQIPLERVLVRVCVVSWFIWIWEVKGQQWIGWWVVRWLLGLWTPPSFYDWRPSARPLPWMVWPSGTDLLLSCWINQTQFESQSTAWWVSRSTSKGNIHIHIVSQ